MLSSLYVPLVLATFLRLASAASLPSQVSQQLLGNGFFPAANEPGIGVELEMGKIVIQGPAKLTPEQQEQIKGKEMTPVGFVGAPKTNWKLTAEIGIQIFPEAIVDGLQNKVGAHKTKDIGTEIFTFFWPNDAPVDLAKFPFGAQVTAAMPLQGVLEILSDAKNRNLANNPLASRGSINANNIKILKRDDFASFKSIKPADINEEFLGFFSLLTSYCVLAETSNPIEGPKRILPIMPRTDFVAQYNQFVEPKLRDQLVSQHTSLYEIIQKVSGEAPTLAKKVFKWKPEVHLAIPDNWLGKEADLKAGTLEVEKFLNYVQGYDKAANTPLLQMDLVKLMDRTLRHGQIGGLGGKMETILGSAEPAAIFEFRDLDNVLAADLGATLGRYEDRVIVYHKSIVPVVRENEL